MSYVVGDFNGDHRADALSPPPAVRTNIRQRPRRVGRGSGFEPTCPLGAVDYTVGDFNADGRSDLIIATAGGTYEYLGHNWGGFTEVWTHPLTRGNVKFTPGDFNGDGTSDLILTTASGSYEYTGIAGSGGFIANAWVNAALALNTSTLHTVTSTATASGT